MHINGPLQNCASQAQQELHRRIDSANANDGLRSHGVVTDKDTDSAERVSSTEVAELKSQLQKVPEVRSDVVQAVSDRLEAGELSSSDVFLRTAAAMLNS